MKRPARKIILWIIGLLGVWGVVIVLLLFLLLLVTLGVIISSRDNTLPFASGTAVEPIPPDLVPIYHAAGAKYHVPWAILAGINRVETDFGRNLSVSSAGATGWMQFEPATWAAYGVDADGDGRADPYDPVDAIFSAANYLSANDAKKHPYQAVFQYNHSSDYVREVLQLAQTYQAWNPLSSEWVWPVQSHSWAVVPTGSQHEPLSVKVRSPSGSQVLAGHEGTVTRVSRTSVTIDIGYGLTFTEQGLTPSVVTGTLVKAGQRIGQTESNDVAVSLAEGKTPLPVTWFLPTSPEKLAPTPSLSLAAKASVSPTAPPPD
ncbi:lytic murein transglycosylase [Alicyclobacillus sp. ALC3]|uniref:lytic murein transglycosylase n=1 Tax=Alicyclobacillus sp. ALC3 TaxID=2796143 RepID=UPI00237901F2|nr:lytic murein transglycosylase [Alicyclobacillus sp. ALC3]WDL96665.1 lytic murein transglycosylase [Alicyclobacillus sp. ALC3]